jgi:dihydropyrimidine dehydrogenase (NAD+) subunit PreT
MCARVCPTETAVRGGLRARWRPRASRSRSASCSATPPTRRWPPACSSSSAPRRGKTVAVVGAGPAGLAAAHRLAMRGHDGHDLRGAAEAGGLNEYGIAATRRPTASPRPRSTMSPRSAASRSKRQALGRTFTLDELKSRHDAVFLGIGLAASTRCAPRRDRRGRDQRGGLHRRAAPGRGPLGAAGRPAGGGDRRRHDGDRRGRAEPSCSAPRR